MDDAVVWYERVSCRDHAPLDDRDNVETVYLETTFISYLVARSSSDVIVSAHQRITQDWWSLRKAAFECCVSQVVIDEVSAGDVDEVKKRMAIVDELPVLSVSREAEDLTEVIVSSGVLPKHAFRDAAHVAVATTHDVDYLLTWNCRHLANAQIANRIRRLCESRGQRVPSICTPEELMGG